MESPSAAVSMRHEEKPAKKKELPVTKAWKIIQDGNAETQKMLTKTGGGGEVGALKSHLEQRN